MTKGSAALALTRLRHDQALRTIAADRARLQALSWRLDSAARAALTADLVSRARTDRRFIPTLHDLMRSARLH